jgi:uncharacterized protein (DUF58 family)
MAEQYPQRYLDPKIIAKISRLDLRARQVVEGFISGTHKSPYHGFSVEFASHREYVPGDEIKHLDWKLWGRVDRYYIKQYEEETNLRCTLLLDCSKSMAYGEDAREGLGKFGCAATIAASLAFYVHQQQDAIGLVTFDNAIRRQFQPSTNPSQLKAMLAHLEECRPDHHSDIADIFGQLAEQIHRRGLVFLISDLFLPVPDLVNALRRFRHRKHDVVVLHTMHSDELEFPFSDNTLFRGLEHAAELRTDPRSLRKAYLAEINRFQARMRKACADNHTDYMLIRNTDELDAALSSYLLLRQRTGRTAVRR